MRTRTEMFLDGTGRMVEVIRILGLRKRPHANSVIKRKRDWWVRVHPHAKYPKHLQDPWVKLP